MPKIPPGYRIKTNERSNMCGCAVTPSAAADWFFYYLPRMSYFLELDLNLKKKNVSIIIIFGGKL